MEKVDFIILWSSDCRSYKYIGVYLRTKALCLVVTWTISCVLLSFQNHQIGGKKCTTIAFRPATVGSQEYSCLGMSGNNFVSLHFRVVIPAGEWTHLQSCTTVLCMYCCIFDPLLHVLVCMCVCVCYGCNNVLLLVLYVYVCMRVCLY